MSHNLIEPWIHGPIPQLKQIISLLKYLNYSGTIIENISFSEIQALSSSLSINNSFSIYNKKIIDSNKRNPNDMDKYRKSYDFLSFHCSSPDLTKWACQDQRIDSLLFPLKEIHKLVDDSTVNLALENDKSIEIVYSSLITNKFPIPLLRNVKKTVFKASRKNLPIIFSSNTDSIYDIRSRHSILGFMNFLDLPDQYYDSISQNWLNKRLERNRERHEDLFLSPGIWVAEKETKL